MEDLKRIDTFIGKHHVMTIATVSKEGVVRTANLFYTYNSDRCEFIFTSSLETAHGSDMLESAVVGANIVLETSKIGHIEGLQIEGEAIRPVGEELRDAKWRYIKRFPYAAVADLEIWVIRVRRFKLTDNKLGFGKKIIWERD